ncbi:MAG: undecaprenyldiphospho-muramoylpentapeptide beta-N-acetylglucosaminyltransferase [Deltaproteobacteria bacterium]|nr:undecaprenyldiphospho-muramoylpentapeptide beta-N-acetylglucosaminyltransferase [Deltaproteobacteria bacterium]
MEAQKNSASNLQSRQRRDDPQASRSSEGAPQSSGGAPQALRIAIAGGGTGGHLFPGIAIAQEFMARDHQNEIIFVSTGNALEKRILSKLNYVLECITVEGIKSRGLWKQFKSVCKLPKGIFDAFRILRRFKPHLIVGLGSYSAGPVVLVARLLGLKVVLCEQNLLPGITNRLLSRFADMIFISFEDSRSHFAANKVRFTGNPVRQDIMTDRATAEPEGGLEHGPKPFTVLIIGGSQGAHRINETVTEALNLLHRKEDLYFIHQTGAADENMVKNAYAQHGVSSIVQAFFDSMAGHYQNADLIVCRAGATTVAEITALGKASLFIPFPYAADDHQALNAGSLTKNGAAEMILEKDLTAEVLAEKIDHYAGHPEALAEMAQKAKSFGNPNAAADIVDSCYQLLAQN